MIDTDGWFFVVGFTGISFICGILIYFFHFQFGFIFFRCGCCIFHAFLPFGLDEKGMGKKNQIHDQKKGKKPK